MAYEGACRNRRHWIRSRAGWLGSKNGGPLDRPAMTQPATHPLVSGHAPPWACGWGRDRHGVFAEFRLGDVRQRLRWIPPGSFWMGSPESEGGRYDDEGPRRLIMLTEGFWLADTPCTQALWQEVMSANPSHFENRPRNPVERVSWLDVQEFLDRLADRLPQATPRLPTEAQWEYACRAGEELATWAGDLKLSEDGVRDESGLLDSIAWYRGNRGGHEGTREVGLKPPNPWGLYDMLGNVFEWVADASSNYEDAETLDPFVEVSESARRVFRGGSWLSSARYVRAAYRDWYHPDARSGTLGFRLSLGPSSSAEPGRREPRRAPPSEGRAGAHRTRSPAGGTD